MRSPLLVLAMFSFLATTVVATPALGADPASTGRATVQIGVDAHGAPAAASTKLTMSCGTETTTFDVGYGRYWIVDVPTAAGLCTLSHDEPAALSSQLAEFDGSEWLYPEGAELVFDPNERSYLWLFDFYPSPWTDLGLFVDQTYLDTVDRLPSPDERTRAIDDVLVRGFGVAGVALRVMEETAHYTESVERVARLYRAFFLRAPDELGIEYWVGLHQSGVSISEIAEQFVLSAEFQNTYGSVDGGEYVELVYNNVLGRTPDQAGYDYWIDLMNNGLTRGGVMTWFSEGDEFALSANPDILIDYAVRTFLDRTPETGDFDVLRADARYGNEAVLYRVLSSGFYFNRFWYEPVELVMGRTQESLCHPCEVPQPRPAPTASVLD